MSEPSEPGAREPEVFLQWKGTDACYDFWCACGANPHFDGFFGGEFTCGACGQTWRLPHTFTPEAVEADPGRGLKLLYDRQVAPFEDSHDFGVQWPGKPLPGMRSGATVQVVDFDDQTGTQQNVYATLLTVEAQQDGGTFLQFRRGRTADGPCRYAVMRGERAALLDRIAEFWRGNDGDFGRIGRNWINTATHGDKAALTELSETLASYDY